MFKIIFFETGLIPIEKKQKLLSLAQVSRILILTVFACSKTHKEVSRPKFEGKTPKMATLRTKIAKKSLSGHFYALKVLKMG